MFGVSTERTGTAKCPLRYAGLLMMAGTLSVSGQNAHPAHASSPPRHPVIRQNCLSQAHRSDKTTEVLETIHNHPTAGAFNMLGVLYAQEDQVSCAISAFQASLRVQDPNWEAHYNLGVALLRTGDRTRATQELSTAIQQRPDSLASRFALASVLEEEKKFSGALEQLRSIHTQDPRFAPATLKLSQILIKLGKPQQAIADLQESLAQEPATDEAVTLQAALGIAYAENGQLDKGLDTLKDLISTQPDSADAHLQLGLLMARRRQPGDQERAATEFREALRLDPSSDASRLALARTLISYHKFSDAVPLLVEYTSHQSKDAQGFYELGLAYKWLHQPEAAIKVLRRSVELESHDSASRFELGKLLAEGGQTVAAIQQLQAAERIDSENPEIHSQLASLLGEAGRKAEADAENKKVAALQARNNRDKEIGRLNEEANQLLSSRSAKAAAEKYQRAVQLNPKDAKLRYNLSLALDRMGDLAAEKKELLKSVELDPQFSVAQNQLGLLALNASQHAEAEVRFKKALEAQPTFAEAQSNLAVVYSQMGRLPEAASFFQNAIKNDPTYNKAHVNYGLLLAQQHLFGEAEQQFRTAIQINEKDASAYSALGMLLAKSDRTSDAVACFRRAAELEPNLAQAHLNLGIALADQFDRTGAFNEFTRAAHLDPQLAAAHYNLGRFYYEGGKYEDADKELTKAVQLQPSHAGALYFLALTAKQSNQPERSTELLQNVVQLEPQNADAQYLLGQDLDHSGNHQGAIEHWRAALHADPNHSQALYNLAKSLGKAHDPEAQQYQERFEALQKKQQVADRVSELGNLAIEAANSQDWSQAIQKMNEAIQLCGNCRQSAHLHKNLGLFYGRTGNINEAKRELRTALELEPNDSDVRNALAGLDRTHEEQSK
jgi:tetratricopeptide (TPR) repeat protein